MSITLNPIERSSIAQFADKVGVIPVVCSLSGLARIVASSVIGLFAALALFATSCIQETSEFTKKCEYVLFRSCDEATRGLIELFPLDPLKTLNFWDSARNKMATYSPEAAYITNRGGAYGNYIYQTQEGPLCYSNEKLEGTVSNVFYQGTEHEVQQYEAPNKFGLYLKPTTLIFTPKA